MLSEKELQEFDQMVDLAEKTEHVCGRSNGAVEAVRKKSVTGSSAST